jgi:hypothetical protein
MWHAIYRAEDRELVSTGTVIADPLPDGLLSVPIDGEPNGRTWNVATLAFDAAPRQDVFIPNEFMNWFTLEEESKIRARARIDSDMATFLARTERAPTITLSHPETIAGVNYCVATGCLSAERGQERLNG